MIRLVAFAGASMMAGTSFQAPAQAQDSLTGGLFGAGAGAIIGGAVTGRAGGAAAGALLGGATGAIIGSQNERPRYRQRGVYYRYHRCYFEYPNGEVIQVASHPC